MSVTGDKVRQLWLPFVILAVLILAISWVLAGVIYPNDIRGGEGANPPAGRETPTHTQAEAAAPTSPGAATPAVGTRTAPPTGTVDLQNCTYTRHHWRENPETWMIENIIVASLTFTRPEAIEILSDQGTAERTRLLQEFFAALLNTLKGADARVVQEALIQASDWLNAHPAGAELSSAEREEAQELVLILEGYNNGEIGPGHCPDEAPTPTPLPSLTPTPTETPTRAPLMTFRPSATPTEIGGGGGGPPKPSNTPAPTDTPPGPVATNTLPPPPTPPSATIPPPTSTDTIEP
jgi:hypothetical protein